MTRPLPAPIKAIQATLQRTRDAGARARLQSSLAYVKRLYGMPSGQYEDVTELRRRQETRPRSPSAIRSW